MEKIIHKIRFATKSQAIICPDSFFHKNESLVSGDIDFKLAQRMYEYFSSGKTLDSSAVIEERNIIKHYTNWLNGSKTEFDLNPELITFGEKLHTWRIDIDISIKTRAYPGEIESILKSNSLSRKQLKEFWKYGKLNLLILTRI